MPSEWEQRVQALDAVTKSVDDIVAAANDLARSVDILTGQWEAYCQAFVSRFGSLPEFDVDDGLVHPFPVYSLDGTPSSRDFEIYFDPETYS